MFSQRVFHLIILLGVVTLAQSVSTVSAEPRADNLASAIEKLSDSGVITLQRAIRGLANTSNSLTEEKSNPWLPPPDCAGNFEQCLFGANKSYELCKGIAKRALDDKTAKCNAREPDGECMEACDNSTVASCVDLAHKTFVMNMEACNRTSCKDLWRCLDDLRRCRREEQLSEKGRCD
jgi:hypothetical protein